MLFRLPLISHFYVGPSIREKRLETPHYRPRVFCFKCRVLYRHGSQRNRLQLARKPLQNFEPELRDNAAASTRSIPSRTSPLPPVFFFVGFFFCGSVGFAAGGRPGISKRGGIQHLVRATRLSVERRTHISRRFGPHRLMVSCLIMAFK
jgi:hypothetical protein